MRRWRVATWALVVWNLLMIGWTATYLSGIGDCSVESGWQLSVCEAGRAIGTGIGAPFIAIVWIVGLAILGLIWWRGRQP